MRRVLPDLRTLPASAFATPSVLAIVATSTDLPLNETDGGARDHAQFRNLRERVQELLGHAVRKVFLLRIRALVTNGSTAIEPWSATIGTDTLADARAGAAALRKLVWVPKYQPSASTTRTIAAAKNRLLPCLHGSSVTPSGVTSNTHAKTSATGNPSNALRMKRRIKRWQRD